jgi:hypothetical protein
MSITGQPRFEPVPRRLPILAGADAGPVEDFDALLGEGNDLWADDAEFELFLAELRRWRDRDRDESRQQ